MLCLVIGTYCEAIGLVLRVVLRNNPHSTGLYIVQYLFVVLSVSLSGLASCDPPGRHYVRDGRNGGLASREENGVEIKSNPQPCAFLAGDYILLGRIVQHLGAPQYIRPFKPGAISWTFVFSDGESRVPPPLHLFLLSLTYVSRTDLQQRDNNNARSVRKTKRRKG
jgi:hypothetical protein